MSFARIAEDAHGGPTALQLAIVRYAPEDERFTVDRISAIHVGDAAYYQDLNERFRAYDVLLYEMIVAGDEGEPGGSAGEGAGGAPAVIERILEPLGRDAGSVDPAHPSRAPPKRDRSR